MDMTIGKLLDEGKLKVRKTVRQGTDGCGRLYWCAKAGFLGRATTNLRARNRGTIGVKVK